MRNLRLLSIIPIIAMLMACGSTPKTEVVTKTVYITPDVPTSLFKPVVPERPMTKELYMNLTIWERETYLTEYVQKLMELLASRNTDVKSIEKILNDTKKAADHEGKSGNK